MDMTKSSRDFPYILVLSKMKNQWEADAWCTEQFGPRWNIVDNREGVWCCFWRGRGNPGSYEWLFCNEKDATLFALRWA